MILKQTLHTCFWHQRLVKLCILLPCYCRYFDKTFTAMLLVFHFRGYTWPLVRWAFTGPMVVWSTIRLSKFMDGFRSYAVRSNMMNHVLILAIFIHFFTYVTEMETVSIVFCFLLFLSFDTCAMASRFSFPVVVITQTCPWNVNPLTPHFYYRGL